jgi:hypothetical protein
MQITRDLNTFQGILKSLDDDGAIADVGYTPLGTYTAFHQGHDDFMNFINQRCDTFVIVCWPLDNTPKPCWKSNWMKGYLDDFESGLEEEWKNKLSSPEIPPMPDYSLQTSDLMVSDTALSGIEARWGHMVDYCYAPKLDKDFYNNILDFVHNDQAFITWVEANLPEVLWDLVPRWTYGIIRGQDILRGYESKITRHYSIKDAVQVRAMVKIIGYLGYQLNLKQRILTPQARDTDGLLPEKDPQSPELLAFRKAVKQILDGWQGTTKADLEAQLQALIIPQDMLMRVEMWDLDNVDFVLDFTGVVHGEIRIVITDNNNHAWEDRRFIGLDESKIYNMDTLSEI